MKPYPWIAPSCVYLSPSESANQQWEHMKPVVERFKQENPGKKWRIVCLHNSQEAPRGYIEEDRDEMA